MILSVAEWFGKRFLEGSDAFFDYEVVGADVEGFAEFLEGELPFGGPVIFVAAAEEVVPDILRLPEVDVEGHGAQSVGDGERGLERCGHGAVRDRRRLDRKSVV